MRMRTAAGGRRFAWLLAWLILAPSASFADWDRVGNSAKFDHYVDRTTRRVTGGLARLWVLNDYYAPESNPNGTRFLSDKLLMEWDCAGERMRILAYAEYSGKMGTGETVNSRDLMGEWRAVIPGSVGETRMRIACGNSSSPPSAGGGSNPVADFEVVNRSAERILGVFVALPQARTWGDDRLGDKVLDPGQKFMVRMPRSGECRFDVRVLYSGRRIEERVNQNLCALNDIAFDGSTQRQPPAAGTAPSSPAPSIPSTGGTQPQAPRGPTYGTGFFVSPQGLALTNHHVIANCKSIVARHDGREVPAQLVRQDERNDLALIRVPGKEPFPAAAFRAGAAIRAGEGVLVAGFPLPTVLQNGLNITLGNVSALAGMGGNAALLQITAPVQPGNSGGPLLDMSGNIVGVVVSKLNASRIAASTGDIPQNVNFAIHAAIARLFLESGGQRIVERPSEKELRVGDVSDRARAVTFQIDCRQ